jgi:hypothetical protein
MWAEALRMSCGTDYFMGIKINNRRPQGLITPDLSSYLRKQLRRYKLAMLGRYLDIGTVCGIYFPFIWNSSIAPPPPLEISLYNLFVRLLSRPARVHLIDLKPNDFASSIHRTAASAFRYPISIPKRPLKKHEYFRVLHVSCRSPQGETRFIVC